MLDWSSPTRKTILCELIWLLLLRLACSERPTNEGEVHHGAVTADHRGTFSLASGSNAHQNQTGGSVRAYRTRSVEAGAEASVGRKARIKKIAEEFTSELNMTDSSEASLLEHDSTIFEAMKLRSTIHEIKVGNQTFYSNVSKLHTGMGFKTILSYPRDVRGMIERCKNYSNFRLHPTCYWTPRAGDGDETPFMAFDVIQDWLNANKMGCKCGGWHLNDQEEMNKWTPAQLAQFFKSNHMLNDFLHVNGDLKHEPRWRVTLYCVGGKLDTVFYLGLDWVYADRECTKEVAWQIWMDHVPPCNRKHRRPVPQGCPCCPTNEAWEERAAYETKRSKAIMRSLRKAILLVAPQDQVPTADLPNPSGKKSRNSGPKKKGIFRKERVAQAPKCEEAQALSIKRWSCPRSFYDWCPIVKWPQQTYCDMTSFVSSEECPVEWGDRKSVV